VRKPNPANLRNRAGTARRKAGTHGYVGTTLSRDVLAPETQTWLMIQNQQSGIAHRDAG
jgi:hypothetical protein